MIFKHSTVQFLCLVIIWMLLLNNFNFKPASAMPDDAYSDAQHVGFHVNLVSVKFSSSSGQNQNELPPLKLELVTLEVLAGIGIGFLSGYLFGIGYNLDISLSIFALLAQAVINSLTIYLISMIEQGVQGSLFWTFMGGFIGEMITVIVIIWSRYETNNTIDINFFTSLIRLLMFILSPTIGAMIGFNVTRTYKPTAPPICINIFPDQKQWISEPTLSFTLP